MVVQDPLVGYIQVSQTFIGDILPSLQVSSPFGMGAPRDLEDRIFFSWRRLIIEYIFHKVSFVLDEGTKDWQQSLWASYSAPLSCTGGTLRGSNDFCGTMVSF